MTSPLDQAWELSPSVALRPETFGAMAYHFGNRRLTFLKRPELVSVVRALADQPDARAALAHAGVPAARWPAYAEALRSLAAADMIRSRTRAGTPQALTPATPARREDHDERIAGRAVRAWACRAHLPDLGAHLRVQPVLRALPVVVRAA